MPTSYTSLLGLALPVTGELSGTWGDTVNDYITRYVDASVAGTQTISGSQTAVTLTVTNGTTLTQVGSGSSGSAQYAVINCTGNPAGLLTITAPASSRNYLIINATSTSQSVKIVGAGPTTGVTLVTGESAIVAWNGSDYVKVASSTADGVTTFSAGTTGFTPSTATSGAVTLAGTLATTNGGTGLTSFTANGVVYASSTSALTTGSALTFDGTNLGVGVASPGQLIDGSAANPRIRLTATSTGYSASQFVNSSGSSYFGRDNSAGGFFGIANGTVVYSSTNDPIGFFLGTNEQMRLTSTGLGIGTSSPVTKLDVALAAVTPSNTSFHGIVVGPDSGTTSLGQAVGIGFRLRNTAGGAVGGNDIGAAVYGIQANTGANTGSLAFYTRPDAASLAERARITSVGNLSLGGSADRGTTVGTNALQIFNGTAPAGTLTNGVSLYSSSGDLFFMDAAGNASRVGYRGVPQSGSAKTTSYTLATTDVGDYIQVGSGGSITIPDATFATGDAISIFNNTTGNITITCSITTAYIAGTDSDKATMTLATRGVATVLFISSTVCVVSGNVT